MKIFGIFAIVAICCMQATTAADVDPLLDPTNPDRCLGNHIYTCPGPDVQQYYYDSGSNTCKTFTWNGCDRQMNNWDEKSWCDMTCVDKKNVGTASDNLYDSHNPNRCKGSQWCNTADNTQYYYDPASNACLSFIWKGCSRMPNNWDSKENCENLCVVKTTPTPTCKHTVPPPCNPVSCSNRCDNGFAADANGCATCNCKAACGV
jgi:hypothetical protein